LPTVVQELPDGRVRLGAKGKTDKLGFPPQTLVANIGPYRLHLAFGESRGPEVAAPDGGFYTQVYTGDHGSPFVELEQLSPQWLAGEPGEFSMYIGLTEAR
jgi:hypothetical protein